MSLLYQNRLYEENNIFDLKRINDSMSEKIKQNQKQKAPLVNQNGSNISSGLNTEKRNIYNKNYYNEEINSGFFNRNGSQSSLSVDLNRFKINPNNFNNNVRYKENNTNSRIYNNNNININLEENFETFNPRKDQTVSIHSSSKNMNINNVNMNNNENIENSSIINNSKNNNKNNINVNDVQKNDLNSILKKFNPYDINNFLGVKNSTNKKPKKNINLVNNIPPSVSNLQMILYNKKLEKIQNMKNPDFLFKDFHQKESRRMIVEYLKVLSVSPNNPLSVKEIISNNNINDLVLLKPIPKNEKENNSLNNSFNNNNKSIENSFLSSNKKIEPFSINETPKRKSKYLMESSSKNSFHVQDQNSFKILNNFLNDMDDESKDKISLLTFLSIPRIMNMIISNQKYSYVFYCSPTNISCLYGIETYIFKWKECKNFNLVGYFDLINVENCYLDNDNRKIFDIILNNNNKNNNSDKISNEGINDNNINHYSIETDSEEIAVNYVNAINFTSQLVKYRIYLNKKKEGKVK